MIAGTFLRNRPINIQHLVSVRVMQNAICRENPRPGMEKYPMVATLDFYCTTSQREVLYILHQYIYLTAVVIGH